MANSWHWVTVHTDAASTTEVMDTFGGFLVRTSFRVTPGTPDYLQHALVTSVALTFVPHADGPITAGGLDE